MKKINQELIKVLSIWGDDRAGDMALKLRKSDETR